MTPYPHGNAVRLLKMAALNDTEEDAATEPSCTTTFYGALKSKVLMIDVSKFLLLLLLLLLMLLLFVVVMLMLLLLLLLWLLLMLWSSKKLCRDFIKISVHVIFISCNKSSKTTKKEITEVQNDKKILVKIFR